MNPQEVQMKSCFLVLTSTMGSAIYAAVEQEPATPRPAATVIVLRRGGKHSDRGLEVCMVQRNPEARFMPGVWVFPGGALDEADGEGDRGHRVCAARELAEEASIEVDP